MVVNDNAGSLTPSVGRAIIAIRLACMFRLEGVGWDYRLDSDSDQYRPWETSPPTPSTQSADKEFIG